MAHETLLWAWMQKQGTAYHTTLDMHRVENGLSRGTPDVEACYRGVACRGDFWTELKADERPKRETTPLRLPMRTEQVLWLRRRWSIGGSCWVYVRIGLATKASRYLIKGCDAERLMSPIMEHDLARLSVLAGDHAFAQFLGASCSRAPFNGLQQL